MHAEIGWLLAALAMLAGAVFALVDGGFRPAPEVDPQAAVDLVLALGALGHARCPFFSCPRLAGGLLHR